MSLEITTKIICDGGGCGKSITAPTEHRATSVNSGLHDVKDMARNEGWISVSRGYHPKAHYCKDCADKPQKPIAKKKRAYVNLPHLSYDPNF